MTIHPTGLSRADEAYIGFIAQTEPHRAILAALAQQEGFDQAMLADTARLLCACQRLCETLIDPVSPDIIIKYVTTTSTQHGAWLQHIDEAITQATFSCESEKMALRAALAMAGHILFLLRPDPDTQNA